MAFCRWAAALPGSDEPPLGPYIPMLTDHGFHAMAYRRHRLLGMTSIGGGMLLGIRPLRPQAHARLRLSHSRGCLQHALPRPGAVAHVWRPSVGSAWPAVRHDLGVRDIFGRFSVGSIFGLIFLIHRWARPRRLAAASFDLSGGYGSRSRWRGFAGAAVLTINVAAGPGRIVCSNPAGGR